MLFSPWVIVKALAYALIGTTLSNAFGCAESRARPWDSIVNFGE